jgi:ABC-2 type transport system ATP-binding protein
MNDVDAIELDGLTKSYRGGRGVVALDLAVPAGGVFGYLGPNGAGKTTTIRVLLDFLRPTAGVARVLGLDSVRDSVTIRRRLGYVPGEPALGRRGTARQLLEWLGELRGGVSASRRAELVERFEVELDRPLRALSRGNRQKVVLVQAFMHEPELLVLDEPTSGLDPLLQHEFATIVQEVTRDGATVFLSSHVLDEVQHLCSRVAIVRDGRLIAVEDVERLRERAVRDVTIRFAAPPDDADRFGRIAGVTDVTLHGDTLRCRLTGSADPLVKLAAEHTVLELTSAAPDLDEVFLHLYEDGERRDAR